MSEKVNTTAPGRPEHDDDPKANLHMLEDAQAAAAEEHNVSFKEALRENWQAAMWSAVISLTVVMEGYDLRYVKPALALRVSTWISLTRLLLQSYGQLLRISHLPAALRSICQ